MTFKEAGMLLKDDGSNKAYRGGWLPQVTNIHIWKEKGKVCHADRDGWPITYYPSESALKANDWHVTNYNEPLEIVESEEVDNKEIDKIL